MATRTQINRGVEGKEFVVLKDPKSRLWVRGTLIDTDEGCIIDGVTQGIDFDNYMIVRPKELRGKSSERGLLWVDGIFSFAPHVTVRGQKPNTVRLKAMRVFSGAFDPRIGTVSETRIDISHVAGLGKPKLVSAQYSNGQLTQTFDVDFVRRTLYDRNGCQICLDSSASVGETISSHQSLSILFAKPVPQTIAVDLLDRIVALLSILTNSSVSPRHIEFRRKKRSAFQWNAASIPDVVSDPYEWLTQPERVADTMERMLPDWLANFAEQRPFSTLKTLLATWHGNHYLEWEFLSFCQCFESLNARRMPTTATDERQFTQRIAPVIAAIKELREHGANSEFRRKLEYVVNEANRLSLKIRIDRALRPPPYWLTDVLRHRPGLLTAIEQRRNRLSHGNPDGAVLSSADADAIRVESAVMALSCLVETLLLGGLDYDECVRLAAASPIARDLHRRAATK
jgi:hypothetical protein